MTDDKEVRIYEKQLFFLRNGDWENIIANHTVQQSSIARLNPILNLALAKKNMLGEKLFDYRPSGVIDLLPQWDNTMDHASLLSDVYYQIGDIATAQKMAFEASVSSINGGSGYLMKRLVETNIIFGAYPVAEKYISILEKTLCYKSFATSCRPLLYNDTTVAKHPQFGSKRQALRKDCQYAVSSKVIQTLEQLAVNNPENRTPMHYLAAMCLLNKDKATFKRLIESYYNTSVWPQLSTLHQQAVVTLEQNNQKYWIQHGASMKVEQDFYGFNDAAKEKQHTPFFQKEMETLFGNTYWFYLLFNK